MYYQCGYVEQNTIIQASNDTILHLIKNTTPNFKFLSVQVCTGFDSGINAIYTL